MTVKEEVSLLSYLGWVLENSGFQTRWVAADELKDLPFEQLLVVYGQDAMHRDLVIRMLHTDEMIAAAFAASQQTAPTAYAASLQFMLRLPFQNMPKSEQVTALDRLLASINRFSPLGNFGFNKNDGLFFRYVYLFHPDTLDPRVIVDLIESVGFATERFSPLIEALLTGQRSLENLLASLNPPVGGHS